ncbi:MAG: type II toxin-antitoxin system HipA family toxin [Bacteroidota bacterium]
MSTITSLNEIKVGLRLSSKTLPVGRLALRDHLTYFEYHDSFIDQKLHISPIKLPLEPGLQTFKPSLFEGLPGVFNDSLPDGWGRLLLDRFLRGKNLLPSDFSPLDRLAHVGLSGLGALVYEPDHGEDNQPEGELNLDALAKQTQEVMEGEVNDVLHELIALNGSSAGARPKALIGIDHTQKRIIHGKHELPEGYEHWIVKFANTMDGLDAGAIEYVYSLMAKAAGLDMTQAYLFPAEKGAGFFATRRFDRVHANRLHMHTASGLLHSDFRTPALDYEDLLALTEFLTKDVREVAKMFRLAVFNVLSHNRDDHGKNFSFLMDEKGQWKLAPAYDLTFSSGPRGHQSTMVMGEGQSPAKEHLIQLGKEANLTLPQIDRIIEQTQEALSQWETLAKNHGVSKSNIQLIKSRLVV